MVENIEQVQILLGKALVSGSPRQNILNLTDIWKNSMTAQSRLTELPLPAPIFMRTTKFLSQTGDYSHVMAQNNASGEVLSGKNRKQLAELRVQASQLTQALHQLESDVLDGKINWSEINRGTQYQLAKEKPSTLGNNFNNIKDQLTQYPTLVYDGPFSDHIVEMEPKGVTGSDITREKAETIAVKAVNTPGTDKLEVTGDKSVKGKIPAYNFSIKDNNGHTYSIDISQKGGHLVNIISVRNVDNSQIKLNEAGEKAVDYLAEMGYAHMKPTYAEVNNNVAYISLAYQKDDILYYPDIIDVQVALDNGQVMAVEAISYLVSHRERDLDKPKLSEEEIRERNTNRFDKVENIRLALIPKSGFNEVLTYEIRGQIDQETYLVYINADTGVEEQILRLIKKDNGTFAM